MRIDTLSVLATLRKGVLWWQLETTLLFAAFFPLMVWFDAMQTVAQFCIYWGAYGFFSLAHLLFWIGMRCAVIANMEANE